MMHDTIFCLNISQHKSFESVVEKLMKQIFCCRIALTGLTIPRLRFFMELIRTVFIGRPANPIWRLSFGYLSLDFFQEDFEQSDGSFFQKVLSSVHTTKRPAMILRTAWSGLVWDIYSPSFRTSQHVGYWEVVFSRIVCCLVLWAWRFSNAIVWGLLASAAGFSKISTWKVYRPRGVARNQVRQVVKPAVFYCFECFVLISLWKSCRSKSKSWAWWTFIKGGLNHGRFHGSKF